MKKKLSILTFLILMLINIQTYCQTWDNKSIAKRKIEICYKVCKGEALNQYDFNDLFEKRLLEIMIKNIKSDKDADQVSKIIVSSQEYFIVRCELYQALADSVFQSSILKNKEDSTVIHK